MAYDTKRLEKQALKALKDNESIVYIEQLATHLPCSIRTFFDHKLHELQSIKDALEANKTSIKAELRDKWRKGDNATTQIALYKLLSTDGEAAKLNSNKVEVSGPDGGPIKHQYIDPAQMSDEDLAAAIAIQRKYTNDDPA